MHGCVDARTGEHSCVHMYVQACGCTDACMPCVSMCVSQTPATNPPFRALPHSPQPLCVLRAHMTGFSTREEVPDSPPFPWGCPHPFNPQQGKGPMTPAGGCARPQVPPSSGTWARGHGVARLPAFLLLMESSANSGQKTAELSDSPSPPRNSNPRHR